MESLRGHFLIASPHLGDPNFLRTVVFIIQHDEEGAFGLVLNRPLDETVRGVWADAEGEPCECDLPIYLGGPVEGPWIALHDDEDHADDVILPGCCFSARQEQMEALIKNPPEELRIFSGYSGWGSGQLEEELAYGGWLVASALADEVFDDVDEMWDRITRRINLDIITSVVNLKHLPEDPSRN